MNGRDIIDLYRGQLAKLVIERGNNLPPNRPLNIDPWVAMSLLQKAIRRGRADLALSSAAILLKNSPGRFWRRLLVTGFEDIGTADHEVVALVVAGLTGKHYRAKIGGEWAVASYLVKRMCGTAKCRAADDLLTVCETHPDFERQRLDLTFRPVPELLNTITGKRPLPERALAMWYGLGNNRYQSTNLRERKGNPQTVFDTLCERGYPETVVEVAREGFKKCKEVLIPFSILLWPEARQSSCSIEYDDLPKEEMIGEVPGWAFDMHVREGNIAISKFLGVDCPTSRWVAVSLPPKQRVRFLGGILFCMESGLVDRRLRWTEANNLRRMADFGCHGVSENAAAEVIDFLRTDLPLLNEMRTHIAAKKGV